MSDNKGQFLFEVLVWIEYPDGNIEMADVSPYVLAVDQFVAMENGVEKVKDQLRDHLRTAMKSDQFDQLKFFASISTQWKGRRFP